MSTPRIRIGRSSTAVWPSFVYDARRTAVPAAVAANSVVSADASAKEPSPAPVTLHVKVPPSGLIAAPTGHVSPTAITAGGPVTMSTSWATITTGVVASHVTPAVAHVTFIVALPAVSGTKAVVGWAAAVKWPPPSPLMDQVRRAPPAGRTSAATATVSPMDRTSGTVTNSALRIVSAARATAATPAVPYRASRSASPPAVAVKVVDAAVESAKTPRPSPAMTDHASAPSPAGSTAAVTATVSPTFTTAGRLALSSRAHVKTTNVSLAVRTTCAVVYVTWTCTWPPVVAWKRVAADRVVGPRVPPPSPPTRVHSRVPTPASAGRGAHCSSAAYATYRGKSTRLTSTTATDRLS